MDEVFVEQIVKKKISISGILMRAIAIIFVLAGIFSMLIIGAREFEKEEDNNQIYAFSATFLALVSLCVSIVSLLR